MRTEFERLLPDAVEHEHLVVRSEALSLLRASHHQEPTTTLRAPDVNPYRGGAAMLILQHAKHPLPVESLLRLFNGDWD